MKALKSQIITTILLLILIGIFTAYYAVSLQNNEAAKNEMAKHEMAKNECNKYIQKKFERYTHVFDVWTKKGKVVVEIGYKDTERADEYSVRLCVVDIEHGAISIPSIFNTSQWAK